MFRTNNAAVFEGEYLAYYPYTKAFTKGQILANLPQTFTVDVQKDKYAAASDSLFSIGYIRHYAGGSSASGLNAKTLNGFLIAKLYNKDTNVSSADKKIKKVIFYTEDVNGIVYRQDLDAAKCVEDLKDGELDSKMVNFSSKMEQKLLPMHLLQTWQQECLRVRLLKLILSWKVQLG